MANNKISTRTIFLLIIIFTQTFFVAGAFFSSAATTTTTSQLKIYVGPTSVPADNSVYNILTVELLDGKGIPLRAKQDITIRLSSSLTSVGTVDSTITILQGSTQASAKFYATYTPGTTTVTAAASGYATVQATITTVGPLPTAIAVYAFPPILPADGEAYQAIIIQLQDSTGAPAKAPIEGVQVALTSSNAAVGTVDASILIEEGKTYATASFTTNSTGTATITALASGYTSGKATVTTQNVGNAPVNLKVYLAPSKVPADGETYQQIAVELQDATGKLAQSPNDVEITLSSSNIAVGTTEDTITLIAGQVFANAEFTTTYKSGTSDITATATSLNSNQAKLTTVGPVPTKLAIYSVPPTLPADGKPYEAIQVQLQDSGGKPAKDPIGDITVYLFSSAPEAGNVTSTLIIPFGQTHAATTFYTTCSANTTTITAQASGYDPGQAKITTNLIDLVFLNVTVAADPSTVNPSKQTTVKAYVAYNGTGPALGATVKFTSNKGGNFTLPKEEGNGYYTTIYTAPKVTNQTRVQITVNATKLGYNGTLGIGQVTVDLNYTLRIGTLQLYVLDGDSPVSGASVVSQSQPAGAATLSGQTNGTGYVTFVNATQGTYSIQVSKSGFQTKTQTIQFVPSQGGYQTVSVKADSGIFSLPLIGAIAAVTAVSAMAIFMVIRKRRNSANGNAKAKKGTSLPF